MRGAFDIESLKHRLKSESSMRETLQERQPEAAVAIIIDSNRDGGSLLLIKRTEREGDPWSGQIAFPGGHKSALDRTFVETAIREASEEVGIQLTDQDLLGVLPLVYSRTKRVLVVPFVFLLRSDVVIHVNEEVAESFWISLGDLDKIEVAKREIKIERVRITANCYVFDDHVIWGLTFRIINILLNRNEHTF